MNTPHDKYDSICICHRCIEENDIRGEAGIFPLSSTRMIVCPECGNKRCPKATDHRFLCTGSNEPGQVGETERYYEGKGCQCEARSESECACTDVDWTTKEVYELREIIQNLRTLVDRQAREIINLYSTVEQLRKEIDDE
jgi:hypothetical protein